ncbi:MAG: preprotein translocase subunit YajC [Deltaproteobacteria bacterium]|nr:MAG: preprotein translocase subunit YajC [Deltaproteobacteria bacterium]
MLRATPVMKTLPSIALLAEGAPAGPNPLLDLLPILLIFAVAYFLLIRPMGKEEKERRKRLEAIKKGDQVVVGGIVGRVSNWDDPHIGTVEIADKVKVRVLKKDVTDTLEAALAKAAGPSKDAKKDQGEARAAKGA